jgi:NAD-dependent aldehyde dehydrogenases
MRSKRACSWHGIAGNAGRRKPASERAAFLIRLAELLEGRADEYGRLMHLERGKPLGEALGEVKKAVAGARHSAESGAAYLQTETIAGTPGRVVYQPLGPVLAIMPWNLPFWQILQFLFLLRWLGTPRS